MRKRAVLFLALLLLVMVPPVLAQSRTLVWDRWDVIIGDVDTVNNSYQVTELYDVSFSGVFRFGSRVIEHTNLDYIDNVQVSQDGRPMTPGCAEARGTFCVTDDPDGTSIVYNFFLPINSEPASFEIAYRVVGGLRAYEGGDQLWWTAIPDEHYGFPIRSSTITVDLPPGFAPREGIDRVDTYGVPGAIQVNGTRIVATATQGLSGNDFFEIRAQYPHSPAMRVAAWQSAFDQVRAFEETTAPVLNVLGIGVALLVGLLGPLGVYYLWYSRGRDPKIGPVPEYLSEPPSDMPPAVVGSLLDERADMRDVLSTLIDLAQRGYLVIEEKRSEGFLGIGGGSDFTFKRTDKDLGDLRDFEAVFMSQFFGSGRMERTMDSLKNKFYQHIPGLQGDLYDEMVREKLFLHNPQSTRNGWTGLGIVIIVIAGLVGFGIFAMEPLVPGLVLIPFALGITGISMSVAGQYMPTKTRMGAEEAAKWNAFRKYMQNLDRYSSVEEAAANFDRYLPYAVAFGLDKAWIRNFRNVNYVPIPPWYYPTYYGPYARGYTAGTPLWRGGAPAGSGGLPGDLARAGGGSLDDMSSGLSGGLESISDGLTSLLNSAGSTLTSRPSSSGSSGSWSSGGSSWSGGGSFGGGSSGGGSSGFG